MLANFRIDDNGYSFPSQPDEEPAVNGCPLWTNAELAGITTHDQVFTNSSNAYSDEIKMTANQQGSVNDENDIENVVDYFVQAWLYPELWTIPTRAG